jgi:hypothetical protein
MATKKVVVTAYGTFRRTTQRTYTHFVISRGLRADVIQQRADKELASDLKSLERYQAALTLALETGDRVEIEDGNSINSADWLRANRKPKGTLRVIKDTGNPYQLGWLAPQWADWRDDIALRIKKHDDVTAKKLADAAVEKYGTQGWCSRLDLAQKLAATATKNGYKDVRIIVVATGYEV